MCGLQVKHLSRFRPRYLFDVGIVWLFNVTGGELRFLSENINWTDSIDSFILIFYLFAYKLITFKWFWITSLAKNNTYKCFRFIMSENRVKEDNYLS